MIEDRAGDRGRDAAGDSRGGGPDADRTGFLVGGKGLPEHGKAVGQDQSSTQALQEPADDERRETRSETNRDRAQAIETDPREEDPLLSEPVAQSAGPLISLKAVPAPAFHVKLFRLPRPAVGI